jgi:hypothetical protein
VHVGQPREFCRLIDAARALRALVDFLQRDEIRLQRADDAGNALQVELLIHPLRVMNVVRDDRQHRGIVVRRLVLAAGATKQ